MAGIGFSLKHIIRHHSLARIFAAYATAGIVSSAPWIISILSILLLGLFVSFTPGLHTYAMQFQITITYLVAGSLITSGYAQNSFARYVADQMYQNCAAYIIPNLHGMLLLLASLAGALSLALIVMVFPAQSIAYRLLFMGCFVTLSMLWLLVNLLTGLRDYTSIVRGFVISYSLIVLLGYSCRHYHLEGLLLAYFCGQVLLVILLMSALYQQYPTDTIIDFHFLQKNKLYKTLLCSGILFNLAIWIDKFMFWYAPATGYHVLGPLNGSLFYDVPIFIAYLTVVPGMGVLLFLIETNFADYYQRFHEGIAEGKSLSYIQVMRDQLISHAYHVIFSIAKIQAVIIMIVFQLGPQILALFHISALYTRLLFIDVIGTSLQIVYLAILNLLYYMDSRNEALLLTALLVTLNGLLTAWSIQLGPFYYGFGFTAALTVCCIYGLRLLDRELYLLEYKIIMLRE